MCSSDLEILKSMGSPLSGGRHVTSVAATISSGVQPSKQGIPQVVPDYATLDTHVEMAMLVRHPFTLPVSTHPAVAKAMRDQPEDPHQVNESREAILHVREVGKDSVWREPTPAGSVPPVGPCRAQI